MCIGVSCFAKEIAASEIYSDFMVRYEIEHGLFGVVENAGARWASISFYRDSKQGEFEATE